MSSTQRGETAKIKQCGRYSETVLIVTSSQKSVSLFSDELAAASINEITVFATAGETKRALLEKDFDIIIIDAPLADETGESLARYTASSGISQVILAVGSEHYDAVASDCQDDGVLVISKPVDINFFWYTLSFAKSISRKFKRIQNENVKLKQKIEDIRVIDRAKCLLISYLKLSEQEAHRFIEKQAMDLRSTKRTIAEEILKTYAN